ncbi:run domain Beclin-1-interacting and cysteine-rich domain-containing protein isoform X1 [Patella vulgata]|uniref:run domain Beclin-1-interacting and cysteine-rich domain-containing protein isoform X1 n=1 Tax=Patella vulgata TaxID=6465 RepID=UPI00217F432A|nr:run domain Beclin-1-interacting and cysteine-rich domain-containing protein isoform X1 [Patella vulgata]
MSFLKKKKVLTQAELLREKKIKKFLTKEFSVSLKNLQQKYLNDDEPVYSNDAANHLCNVLEAVFLHGLKDSVTAKIASYVNFNHDHVNQVNANFWNYAAGFTHKDVISQLKHLGQITTEIGLCRAWIRLGLNDGLMESYLESMTADKKTLEYYYHQVSYLRDIEQPGILISYMKGLIELNFKLSFNSSVLNNWTTTPLTLSGILEPTSTPSAIVDVSPTVSDSKPPMSTSRQRSKSEESPILARSSRSKSKDGAESDNASSSAVPKVPPNTPFSNSGFTRQDVEDIKKLIGNFYSPSDCSGSSQISCPDPDHAEQQNPSPRDGFFVDQDLYLEEAAQTSEQKNFHDEKYKTSLNKNKPHELPVDSKALIKEQKLKGELVDCPRDTQPNKTVDSLDTAKLAQIEAEILNCPIESDISYSHSGHKQTKHKPPNKPEELSPHNSHGNHSPHKSTKHTRRHSKQDELPPFESLNCSPREKSAPIAPTLSTAVVETVDTVEVDSESSIALAREEINKHKSSPKQTNNKSENGVNICNSPRSFGNNLSHVNSWSSPFDEENMDHVTDLPRARASSTSQEIPQRNKSESFGTLLQNYTPSSVVTSASMDEVLQNLDTRETTPPPKPTSSTGNDVRELSDSGLDDYEIVPDSYLSREEDAIISTKKQQMTEIALEKGLDAQNYQCNGCKRPVGLFYGKPRVCTFDGGYYCFECHENEEFYIPASIVHNWDFRKQQVCKANYKFLMEHEEEALLDVSVINPKLYDHVPEMQEVKLLRIQLFYLKTYLFTCKQSVAEELRRRVWPREFLYDNIHVYSLGDFFHVYSGQLAKSLKEINKFASKHVYDCLLCSQKGFICEICSSKKVIYPFETITTHRCSICNAVFHKSCMSEKIPCPRCQRWRRRKSNPSESLADTEDYANTPDL